eukprot:EG_transcript_4453
MADQLISSTVARNLADNKQDVRKKGAQEIETQVKLLRQNNDWQNVRGIIHALTVNFTRSVQTSHRKGGLLALAATAIALFTEVGPFLGELVPPVIECFSDQDATVRFHACETMYNIAKVARADILPFFGPIFEGLVKLSADNELKVQNATFTLDRLIKDIATETDAFDVAKFIGLVKRQIGSNNPYIRQFLVSWLMALDAVPDINVIKYLPEFLDGLFAMLSDRNKEIVQMTETLLGELNRELHEGDPPQPVAYGPLIKILIAHCASKEDRTRKAALGWLLDFLENGRAQLLPFAADLIRAVFPCISDKEEAIRATATKVNDALATLMKSEAVAPELEYSAIKALQEMLVRSETRTRIATLHWILMLLDKDSDLVLAHFGELFPLLLKTLSDASASEEVVTLDLAVLATLSKAPDNFKKFLHDLVDLLKRERKKLLTRSSVGLIVRQLSLLLNPERLYRELAAILREEPDKEFVGTLVQLLNMILLTSAELMPLRELLRGGLEVEDARSLFLALYYCWSYNAVATLSLCLLAMAHEHAYTLVCSFGEMQVTVNFLTQIDKLVQLLESPIFAHVRLQLLEPTRHPYLVKTLFGILMLLPQSSAYDLLKNRLKSVSTLTLTTYIQLSADPGHKGPAAAAATAPTAIRWAELFAHFSAVQQKSAGPPALPPGVS